MVETAPRPTPDELEARRQDDFTRAEARKAEMKRRREDPEYAKLMAFDSPEPVAEVLVDDGFDPAESRSKAEEILRKLGPDEPFFVFRAKDILSTFALDEYAKFVEKFSPQSPQLESLTDVLIEFRYWQRTNPDKVKLPD